MLAKILATVGVVTAIGALFMFGAFAVFTDTQNVPNNTFSVGTLDISTSPTTALVTFSGMAPGDEVTNPITVTNSGTLGLSRPLSELGWWGISPMPYTAEAWGQPDRWVALR